MQHVTAAGGGERKHTRAANYNYEVLIRIFMGPSEPSVVVVATAAAAVVATTQTNWL